MKQVTIENVKARMTSLELQMNRGDLSLREEFELDCLRALLSSMEAKPGLWEIDNPGEGTYFVYDEPHDKDWRKDMIVQRWYAKPPVSEDIASDVRNVVALLETTEWAEHCTSTVLGSRLESQITRLVGSAQPAPVVPDEKFQHALFALNETLDDCGDSERGLLLALDKMGIEVGGEDCRAAMLQGKDEPVTAPDAEPSFNAMMRALNAFYADDDVPERAMLAAFKILLADVRNQVHDEPATDNTAQQFESLASANTTSKPGPSVDAMERALNAYYATDNVREGMLKAYQIMHADVLATSAGSGKHGQ